MGRQIVSDLAKEGWRIRVACRRPDLAFHLKPLGDVGQIQLVQANIRYPQSVEHAISGSHLVINLVGLLEQYGKQTFQNIHEDGAGLVAEICASKGARLIHVSALGADLDAPAIYYQSKAKGEMQVLDRAPQSIIFRPSVIFGPRDKFFNRFAGLLNISPFIPLPGGGKNLLQPVYVGDVSAAIVKAAEGEAKPGQVYELGGKSVLSLKDSIRTMAVHIGKKPIIISIPMILARLLAWLTGWIPGAPLSVDQVNMLKTASVVSSQAQESGRTLEGLGIEPTDMNAVLPAYMVSYRNHGQFAHLD